MKYKVRISQQLSYIKKRYNWTIYSLSYIAHSLPVDEADVCALMAQMFPFAYKRGYDSSLNTFEIISI